MLLLTEINLILKKRCYKQNSIRPSGFDDSKMVFALLIEVIIFYVGPITIDIRQISLGSLIPGFFL